MTKIDENGWTKTNGVELAVSETLVLLVLPKDRNAEILELDLVAMMQVVSIYLTKWQMFKAKMKWIWTILKMSN